MDKNRLREIWKREEDIAHICGWDFSHIHGRYAEEDDLPWDYAQIVRQYLNDGVRLLDYDTGGGEFLLSLNHPYAKTAATEGYPPNVRLCRERLLPLGIDFKECGNPAEIPFEDASFDVMINRHGDFDAPEIHRLLRRNGVFITEQVGGDNDRDLVEMVLPGTEKPFPHLNLSEQRKCFEQAGFRIVRAEEAYRPITFYDIGAFVWFARIIEWEFPGFSVDACFERLLKMQEQIEKAGKLEGTIHRYLIVAEKYEVTCSSWFMQGIIGKTVSGTIDRPIGSHHPRHPDMIYPVNYGYVDGFTAGDGAEQDAYVFGTNKPIPSFTGKVIAVYHRFNDVEDKWIVSLDGSDYSDKEILQTIHFQEQYFEGELVRGS